MQCDFHGRLLLRPAFTLVELMVVTGFDHRHRRRRRLDRDLQGSRARGLAAVTAATSLA